jgi:hypothetical protein
MPGVGRSPAQGPLPCGRSLLSNRSAACFPPNAPQMYKESITNPDKFWAEQADELLHWETKWTAGQPLCT